jgi:hypothetical protein
VIPRSVEILGSSCFSSCESLSSISFESNSELTRIDSDAFSLSSLHSIIIPSNVQSIDGSAFSVVDLSNLLIESGNQRFVFENCFLIDVVDHKLIRNFSESSHIEIPADIEILGSSCFAFCKSLSAISFECNSRLTRIDSEAFASSSLQSIVIHRSVEILGSSCFEFCESLSSISFESNSRLTRIESGAFPASLPILQLPSSILFVAHDAHPNLSSLSLSDADLCRQFDR